jgi:NADH-quinone oxidoreductase subunit A
MPELTQSPYIGLFFMGLLSAGFLIGMLLLSIFVGPRHRTRTKQIPFECGSVSVGDVGKQRFGVGFYLVAMLFILFDIEVVFLYPWAVVLRDLGWSGLIQMGGFLGVLGVGLIYVWGKGILDWND